MKIKILFVIENSFFGGGERAFAQIINGLDKEKFEIYVACLSHEINLSQAISRDEPRSAVSGSELFIEKVRNSAEIIPFDLRNRFNFRNISYLASIIKEKNIQIVHSQGARVDFFARFAAKRTKVPVVISTVQMPVEGFNVNFFKKTIYIFLDRFSEKFVNRFIVVSEALKKRLIEKHRISSGKVSLIYNGVEIESDTRFRIPDTRKKIREELKIPENTMLVGTIGRLVWQKGLPYFLEAVEIITQSPITNHQSPVFLIVGEGELRSELENLAKRLEISDRVIFTGFRKDVKEILAALDILVLASLREGFPMITLEAMAMGEPVVATDIEGIREQVINGETGILVPLKNPQALAEAILRLAQDKELRTRMGLAGRRLVEQKFDIREIIKQHEQLYLSLYK